MGNRLSADQKERLKKHFLMVLEEDALTERDMSEILGICIDACKRKEIEATEEYLLERIIRE